MDLDNLTRQQLQAGLQAVFDRHKPYYEGDWAYCSVCETPEYYGRGMEQVDYPCPTIQDALDAIKTAE